MKKYYTPPFGLMNDKYDFNGSKNFGLQSLLKNREYGEFKSNEFTFILGLTDKGEILCPDLAALSHLLIIGSSGSGKTNCIYSILISLLYKYGYEEFKLLLIDPDKNDLSIFEGLPHMLTTNILRSQNDVIAALNWITKEVEQRYERYFGKVDRMKEFMKLPRIVVIIENYEEFNSKQFGIDIVRLILSAHKVKINLIITAQLLSNLQMSKFVLENIPTKIILKNDYNDDLQNVIGLYDKYYLYKNGNIIFQISTQQPIKARGCLVTYEEVKNVIYYIKSKNILTEVCTIDSYIKNYNN